MLKRSWELFFCLHVFIFSLRFCALPARRGREGGFSRKNWVGVCGPRPKTLTLFMTKICDIPNPIYDLTKNSKPNLWPEPYIKILFQTCVIIGSLVQTNVTDYRKLNLWRAFVDFLVDSDEKVAFRLKSLPISRLGYKNHTLFITKMAKIS